MITVDQLTGFELRELASRLGRPFPVALQESDTDAMYLFVWIAERRDDRNLELDDVLARPFGDIIESFAGMDVDGDPTVAPSGGA